MKQIAKETSRDGGAISFSVRPYRAKKTRPYQLTDYQTLLLKDALDTLSDLYTHRLGEWPASEEELANAKSKIEDIALLKSDLTIYNFSIKDHSVG